MTEEKFFKSVHDSLSNYAPEVPASVYAGMRRKMWWNGFLSMNWNQLNIWYVLLGASLLSSVFFFGKNESTVAKKVEASTPNMEQVIAPATVATKAPTAAFTNCASNEICSSKKTSSKSAETPIFDQVKKEELPLTEIKSEETLPVVTTPTAEVTPEATKEEVKVKAKKGKRLPVEIIVDEKKNN